ncbi:LegC family aminotransferase [Cetobacterium sp.]|uniref:LegC family aminotransferase n=1 Tax=Cetobacterium sp. TaxID=2071632 RepID=UPI003F3F64C4
MKQKINLSVPNLDAESILSNLKECIESGWVSTGGRFIEEFEEKIAKYVGVQSAVGVQSGTAALHTALRVLGVESGDEVLVPTLTFIAAVNPVVYQHATPVFIGCDDTLCIDPNALEFFLREECIRKENTTYNKKTSARIAAIIVVHVFGNTANMERIMELAAEFNFKVLEDATEALGSYYLDGRYKGKHAGTIGDLGVYSFNANKIITTGGGGMVVSHNEELLNKIKFLTTQAKTDELYFIHDEIGYNYRMLNLQAALGTSQIDSLEDFIEVKTRNYDLYKSEIDAIEGLELIRFNDDIRPNYWFYSVLVQKEVYGISKDELLLKLIEEGVATRPIWGLIHEQKPYRYHEAHSIETAKFYHDRILNIPCSSNLTSEEVEIVIKLLKKYKNNN